jgi:hypothetical protein
MKPKLLGSIIAIFCLLLANLSFAQTDTVCGYNYVEQMDTTWELNRIRQVQEVTDFRTSGQLQTLPNGSLFNSNQTTGSGVNFNACHKALYIVPVVVHIIHNPAHTSPGTGTNISDVQVASALRALNTWFANEANTASPAINTGIQFCLIPSGGITRRGDSLSNHRLTKSDINSLMALDYQQHDRYLNIWVVESILDTFGNPSGVLGYATPPNSILPRHGIVINYKSMGNVDDCSGCTLFTNSIGGVLVHEAGHFLGLRHPFDGGCAGNTSGTCAIQGDLCCDVPPVYGMNFDCNYGRNTCTETPTDHNDQIQNFMDYSDESCTNTLTTNQTEIMQATLNGSRRRLSSPSNINALGVFCCHRAATFDASANLACTPNDSIILTSIAYSGFTRRWYFFLNGSLVHYYSGSSYQYTFKPSATGMYTIKLTIYDGADSVSFVRNNYVEAVSCGVPLPSPQSSWIFGKYAGIKFTTAGVIKDFGPQIGVPDNIDCDEGSITQSNAAGQLLFYAAGIKDSAGTMAVYNKQYRRMLNSYGLLGDYSATQVGLSLPFPGNGTRYYLITNNSLGGTLSGNLGLRYSVVDTTLDGGNGGIVDTMKNKPILGPWFITFKGDDSTLIAGESNTAIPKCNGSDYWLIVRAGPSIFETYKGFLIYEVTSSGITYHNKYDDTIPGGALKASPDGRFLTIGGKVYTFDRETGTITGKYFNVNAPGSYSIGVYGASFSPNSQLLYLIEGTFTTNKITQYNLYNLLDGIASTKKVIYDLGSNPFYGVISLQLAPNNKLYGTSLIPNRLKVINYPNLIDSVANACGYNENTVFLAPGATGMLGFPNMVDAKKTIELNKDFSIIFTGCRSIKLRSNIHCANFYKWYFGDGDSTSGKDTSHNYTSDGVYTIKLITQSDTITRDITIGLQASIAGDTLFCDTPVVLYHSTSYDWHYSYNWQALHNGGVFLSPNDEYNPMVKWTEEDTLRLIVRNNVTGCIDTALQTIRRRIPPISGNTIDSSQAICLIQDIKALKGNRPTGGSGTFTYQWRKKEYGGEWTNIQNATDTFYLPISIDDSTLYIRVAKSGGCEKASNVLSINAIVKDNLISTISRACISKDSFIVNGSIPTHQNDSVFTYSWQYSLDSISWDSISFEHAQNLKWSYAADSIYLRRRVITSPSGCERYSNVLKVHPLIYFTKQPRSKPVCRYHPGEYVAFDSEVRLHKDTAVALHYFWQVKASNDTSSWNDTTTYNPATDTSYRYFSHSFTGAYEDSVRCIVFTPCGKIYSSIAIMYIMIDTIDYEFVIPPTSVTVSEGGSAYFTTYLNSDHGFEYFWQESKDGGETWQTIPGETDIDITINNVTRCMNKTKYRLAVFNGCYNWYSAPATLDVTSSYVNSLMMRDATDDTGTEPYPNNNIWASPDIWFSRNSAATYDYNNNNIEYKKLTPIGYAKVQVKNTGSTTSPAQKVVVHWTIASTLELWPKHWLSTSDNIIINNVPSSQFYQDTFYRGGVIDTVTIGPMTAGSTQVIVLPWEVPNPAWYGVNGLDSSLMVCLLGRILTCDEKPYGMTFPEGLVTATNARNNRKIITRNFHVVDTASGDMQGKPGGGNYWAQNMDAAFNLKAISCDYFDYGVVDIVMDDVLSNAWYANGAHGTGFTVIDDHTIRITDSCDVWLTDVAFGPNEETQVKIHFVTDESYERTTPMSFDFEWYQYNQDSLALDTPLADGGMMLRCDLPDNVAAHYLDNQILVTSSGIPYKHSICNGATPPPLIGSNPVTPAYWTYQWQSTTDTMGVWTDIPGATDRDYNPSINNMNMFYRRGALKQHALALNYSPIFFMRLRDPMILTPPANASVDEGDIATFIVRYQDMEVVNWTRTHSSIGTIIDETSDTLNFQTQECYNGNTFQAVLRDVCTSIETSTSSATLTVNPVSDNLYAQDNTSGSFIWSSPDMINRRDNDNGSTHQTPEFGNPNYIYTTVRNNGMDASAPAKLYLYWSVATTGAAWERNWKFDTTESAETGNWIMHQGAKTPLGGLIGIYDIPSIASSSYYRSETEWNPIDPAVYGMDNTTLSDIILLGRIVTCEDEPYGMNPPEVNDLAYNVRYNERIISKHKIVTDVIPGNDVIHKAGNGNINDISMDGRLVFKAVDCDYFQYGYVLLHTDATLQSIWTNSDGSGYTIVDDSTLQVDSCQNALLWDIGYGANQRTWLGVEFVTWDTLTVDTTEDYYFEFDLEQYMNGDNDTSVGGIRYGVPIHLEPPAPESLIRKEDLKERITFTAYPNPFRDEMNITYKLPQDANVSITVMNMLGQQVRVLEQGNLKTAGTHRLLLNSSFLKEGIYFINFTAGSFTQTQKVVLIR